MKRFVPILAFFALALGAGAQTLKDGKYFAQEAAFEAKSGWKYQVSLEVKGGKIVSADWNAVSNLPGVPDKKAYDKSGKYGMKKFGKAQAEWFEQAAVVEQYLVKSQDLGFSKIKADGKTDAITGASVTVKEFFDLAKAAVAAGPVAKGPYSKDGRYYAEQAAFDPKSGWKDTVLVTVVNGSVVDAVWNGVYKDKTKKSKIVDSTAGTYGMVKFGKAKAEWHEQAALATAALAKAGDPAKVDAVSGVSISIDPLVKLAAEALKAAK